MGAHESIDDGTARGESIAEAADEAEKDFHFERLRWKRRYRYTWLKHVRSVDLHVHCAKSLVGWYDKHMDARCCDYLPFAVPNDAPIMYLCATDGYEHNVHIPFRFKRGSYIRIADEHCEVVIRNAEYLPLGLPQQASRCDWSQFVYKRGENADKAAFKTCRNWQFANWVARNLDILFQPQKA